MVAGSAGQGWKMAAVSTTAIVKEGSSGVSGEGVEDGSSKEMERWQRRREEGSKDNVDGMIGSSITKVHRWSVGLRIAVAEDEEETHVGCNGDGQQEVWQRDDESYSGCRAGAREKGKSGEGIAARATGMAGGAGGSSGISDNRGKVMAVVEEEIVGVDGNNDNVRR
ncbi:hypothetical protein B296_00008006 [Ensete ventricosum]|uniref:DUF834 domain-containing protein n=1 Tax=Ensete ventricosum TaxID=4639 RepID=A0A427AYL4_ENSVE|nr:hypothetical protein B296_00008006 [Ensete ventricosum]